jgi:hypothetical protein
MLNGVNDLLDSVLAQQVDNLLAGALICVPDRAAPGMDCVVPVASGKHVSNTDLATIGGQRERGPRVLSPRQRHMHLLDLLAGELLFNVQVKPDEREGDLDGLRVLVCHLRRKCVNQMLVNERLIWMGQGAVGQLVVNLVESHGGLAQRPGSRTVITHHDILPASYVPILSSFPDVWLIR